MNSAANTAAAEATSTATATKAVNIAFTSAGPHGAPVTAYSEAGFTVMVTQASWVVWTTHGNPGPSIVFNSPAGATTIGEISIVSDHAAPFKFSSVDLYASIIPIPYAITGEMNGRTQFTMSGTVPNTFGRFARVFSSSTEAIDRLVIQLTNAAPSCCSNPMGVDNIGLRP